MGGANVMWVHYIREVSNNDGDGLLRKRHLKSRAASNFIALIPSRLIRQMLANFFLTLNSNGLCQNSGKEKESRCLVCTSSKKREISNFYVVVVQ